MRSWWRIVGTHTRICRQKKNGGDEISGMVSSYVSFDGTNDGNIEGVVPGEGNTRVILEGNGHGIKLGISDGEFMGTTLGYVYGLKLGSKEVSEQVFSYIPFYGSNVLRGV